jgi:uncharacterized membrane protein (DUF485 family)
MAASLDRKFALGYSQLPPPISIDPSRTFDGGRPPWLYWRHSRVNSILNNHPMFISTRTTRIGLSLFAVYLLFYGGFVLLAAFSPQTMEATPLAGVNLAIWYGFGLIVAAIFLALVYGWACRASAQRSRDAVGSDGGQP